MDGGCRVKYNIKLSINNSTVANVYFFTFVFVCCDVSTNLIEIEDMNNLVI